MTTYGTIPSPSPPRSSNLEFISHAKAQIKIGLAARRPWKEMFQFSSMTVPRPLGGSIPRIRVNIVFFRVNYAILVLAILYLSLLWHPISLIVLVVMMVGWLFFYFLRDEPLVLLGHVIDDRVVMMVLFVGTILALSFTHASGNIIAALFIGATVVLVHGALRETDDLEEPGPRGGRPMHMPLRDTASASYSFP